MIELAGVAKSYRKIRAVDDLTLSVGPGITGLLGANGAGKTTLLRMVATVVAPDAGGLHLLGLDPRQPDERVEIRRQLGYVPQEPGFHPSFTATEFVDYVAILKEMTQRRERRAEVRRVLDLVGLTEVADRRIKALSGGMRRRLGIAQALLGSPKLVVLDEPTAGLDPEQRLRFRELISRLGEDVCVLLSTHQTDDVGALCRRVVVLGEGRVRFDGSPATMARQAEGKVWLSHERDERAWLTWVTGEGRVRNIGVAPPDAELAPPTIEDAYLLLLGASAQAAPA